MELPAPRQVRVSRQHTREQAEEREICAVSVSLAHTDDLCLLRIPAPTAALFFITYETCKTHLTQFFHRRPPSSQTLSHGSAPGATNPLVHCLAASVGEVVACLVRVPTENVKQKVQAGQYRSSWECFRALLAARPETVTMAPTNLGTLTAATHHPSALQNFYRGFGATILREIPFAFLQFPLYEWSKWKVETWKRARGGRSETLDGATCALLGSISGGVAAAATTPLDVVKTRLMLQSSPSSLVTSPSASPPASSSSAPPRLPGAWSIFLSVYHEGGLPHLFSGVVPRVLWIGVGGGVFFGAYEISKKWMAEIM